ncbi:MerR family transcriptional regulator [Lacticaseibacillus sp. N501-2]|uniref:MerR family transcriptional regulator n=1 Tax=Lacticaseibacillus salsurae TaxID=3367729 RepID=UPI0038B2978E
MTYTIQEFAQLSGVTPRTLRYYHQLGLVEPNVAANGYRQYSSADADRLQQVLMFTELGFSLKAIKSLLDAPASVQLQALADQEKVLATKLDRLAQSRLRLLLTRQNLQGDHHMTDPQKFAAFKQAKLAQNDAQYGQEVVATYGDAAKRAADQHFMGLTEAQYTQMQTLEAQLKAGLIAYLAEPTLPSTVAQQVFEAHRNWLKVTTPKYSPSMHQGIVKLYLADERFAEYYTKLVGDSRATDALVAIVDHYLAQ